MSLGRAVRMMLVLFMLCSGFSHFTFATNYLRFFTPQPKANWDGLLKICKEKNQSIVTLYDEEDGKFVSKHFINESTIWLGLHRTRVNGVNASFWSNGIPFTFNISSVNVSNGEQICEAIENNRWKGFNCSGQKSFMCYKGNKYILIETEKKNWCQAQLYCRKYFDDLVSISNETQNQQVIEKGKKKTFWIGLMHDEWEWVDKGCSTYRDWDKNHIVNGRAKNHVKQTNWSPLLTQEHYTQLFPTLCSSGTVRIKVIKENLTWEEAYNYCQANHTRLLQIEHKKDQEAVEQWLNSTDVESNLFWIGLRQSRVFGFWIWSNTAVTDNKWKNEKPPEMPFSNHCGVISKNDNYTWSDENCLYQHYFLCEEDISFTRE
ncbi:C-type mannose receptor 2-like [Mastacembelus armatus]|uniref:C-type mannose receptor 2-like n=1 Tax=Mastacembelus armatus TaxID=205130 RepID=UPI000E45922D|nr:C-type mannose receptor 2-like [Mastacembelus armatus]